VKKRLAKILGDMAGSSVVVIGDLMLDEYVIGEFSRISPEAPEPIIEEHERVYVPGGAGNVAVNIKSLGAEARLFGVVGDDADGRRLRELLREAGVDHVGVLTAEGRPTTRKTRLIARGKQVYRIDRETTTPIDRECEREIAGRIGALEEETVLVSDYAKGVVTDDLVGALTAAGKRVVVDPKSSDFAKYSGAFLVTPNYNELFRAAGLKTKSPDLVEETARGLMKKHGIGNLLITLGAEGMILVEGDRPSTHIHSKAMEVYDVTGAGDTVIAAVSAAVSAGMSLDDACFVANIAAAVVVGKPGTATASPREIMDYAFGPSASGKIVDRETLAERVKELKREGKRIVFTNGCFDILHMGHITYLNESRGLGDVLIVGVNTDDSVRRLKGENRPIIPEEERVHVLAALECVDYVVLFGEDTPVELIEAVRPDVLVKGADYTKEQVVGREIVESYGGVVRLIPVVSDLSTTTIINRIREGFPSPGS